MSKRAEQAALKAYPEGIGLYGNGNAFGRHFYIQGYEQAEKDLALTWEDVRRLLKIEGDLLDEGLELKAYQRLSHKKFCQEILRRFNEQMNKQ